MEIPDNPTIQELQKRAPWAYQHKKCGTQTVIDVTELSTMFDDPYQLPYTFCAGCQKHYHDRQFFWVESGENLFAFVKRLRARKSLGFKICRLVVAPLIGGVIGGAISWFTGSDTVILVVAILGGVAGGWMAGGFIMALFRS